MDAKKKTIAYELSFLFFACALLVIGQPSVIGLYVKAILPAVLILVASQVFLFIRRRKTKK